ncbi:MAG: prepilin-type N-terminal cleavage/methylation domain-containing protein [Planctomycetota bacterium]|jgi:prepilin-type N-terminal cleavage/methylation domain-containing protein
MQGGRYKGGFSFFEVLIAIVLIGIAIASLLAANSSFTKANAAGTELSTAEFLLEQIKELTIVLPVIDPNSGMTTFGPEADETTLVDYDDLDDFDDAVFSPPISSSKATLNGFAAYTQQITVENVSPTDFEQVVADHGSNFVRVTVKVLYASKQIVSADWVRASYVEP